MNRVLLSLALIFSNQVFSHQITFSLRGVDYKGSKSNVLLIKNEYDLDLLVQVLKENTLKNTFKINKRKNRSYTMEKNYKYTIMSVSPPSREVEISSQ
jgi:hypothetical protein